MLRHNSKQNHQPCQSKFEFLPCCTEKTKKLIDNEISTKWRQWKSEIKSRGYNADTSIDDIKANIPDSRVDKDQWGRLVDYWKSDKGKRISEINKENRAKLDEPHCIGTKYFPRFIEEKTQENNGVRPSRAQIYVESCTCKDGSIIN